MTTQRPNYWEKRNKRKQFAAYLETLEYAANYSKQRQNINFQNIAKMNEEKNTQCDTAKTGFSFARSYNKTTFDIDVTEFEYVKLATLYNAANPQTVYRVDGMWVTKSPLGDSPVFACCELGKLVNMPSHTAAMVREIVGNSAAVDAIKGGKVGFTVYEYESHGKKCYNVRFVDL